MSATFRARAGGAFVAGGLAMTVAVLVVLVLRVVAQQATLPELIGDQLVRLIPGSLFEVGIQTLGPLAKKVLFVLLTLGMVGIGGLLGVWLDRWRPLGPAHLERSVGFAVRAAALALLVGGFLTGLLGGGNALFAGLGTLLIQSIVFGIGLAALAGLAAAPIVHCGGTISEVVPMFRRDRRAETAPELAEIVTPRANALGPSAMEQALGSLLGEEAFGLEIVATNRSQRFLIRADDPSTLRALERQLGATYPQASFRHLDPDNDRGSWRASGISRPRRTAPNGTGASAPPHAVAVHLRPGLSDRGLRAPGDRAAGLPTRRHPPAAPAPANRAVPDGDAASRAPGARPGRSQRRPGLGRPRGRAAGVPGGRRLPRPGRAGSSDRPEPPRRRPRLGPRQGGHQHPVDLPPRVPGVLGLAHGGLLPLRVALLDRGQRGARVASDPDGRERQHTIPDIGEARASNGPPRPTS